METNEISKEERILRMMKRVLTDVAKDTHSTPGLRHPLSENTIAGMRECLSLIAAREAELAAERGQEMNMRPRFIDEPKTTHTVSIDAIGGRKDSES